MSFSKRGSVNRKFLDWEVGCFGCEKMAYIRWQVVIIFSSLSLFLHADCHNIFWKSNDNNIFIIDGVFAKSKKVLANSIKTFASANWKFTVDQFVENEENIPMRVGFATKSKEMLKGLKAPKILQKLVSETFGCPNVFLTDVHGKIIERGDFSPVVTKCSVNSSRIVAILTLSKKWKKNDYGEITIYDDKGDILKSVHPKFGRVVLIKCGLNFKISPPCVNMERRHYFLMTEFGHEKVCDRELDDSKVVGLSEFFNSKVNIEESSSLKIDPEKLVTRKFLTKEGKRIFVYDNAVPSHYVDVLSEYIHNQAEYFESPVVEKDSADNVKWIISLDDPGFISGPIWKVVKQLLVHIAGKEFYPYDLACNHIRRTDNTYNHKDNYENADEYTVLIYLNKDWKDDNYGETTFLDGNEIVAALRPRYGRVAIFHGTIDHSAHPASPDLGGARYTFAIKTAASKELAMKRILETEEIPYSDTMSKLDLMAANGTPDQKSFAKMAIGKLQGGGLPGEGFLQKLKVFLETAK